MPETQTPIDLVIIGAGPVGVEAALYAQRLGMAACVLEQGDCCGASMRSSEHAALFAPWQACYSPLGVSLLRSRQRFVTPTDPLRWSDYLDTYLQPLAELISADVDIRYQTRVLAIGRSGVHRAATMGTGRQAHPFRLLLSGPEGTETTLYARRVIDATGVRGRPLWIGQGRVPAINERALRSRILLGSHDLAASVRGAVAGVWLVIGDGYEAAMAVYQIRRFMAARADVRLIFIDEQGRKPRIKNLKNDVYRQRVDFIKQADDFLDGGHPRVHVYSEASIHRLDAVGARIKVGLDTPDGECSVLVDHLVGAVGFAADDGLWQELQVHQCYVSGAPMSTSRFMLNDMSEHQLTRYAFGPDSLKNPEPDFYVLGAKSYGRYPGFSLHIGLGQIISVYRNITGDKTLDLYAGWVDTEFASMSYLEEARDTAEVWHVENLSDSEQKYKNITENLQEVIFQTNLQQLITYLSPSWKMLTGKDPNSFLGLHWQALLSPDSRQKGLLACNVFMAGDVPEYHQELEVEHIDGSLRWVEVRAKLLVDRNGVACGTIGSMVDITDRINIQRALVESNQKLEALAVTDALTGLYNRRYFDQQLEYELRRAQRERTPLTLALIDIDHFKQYNDTYGHPAGDAAIQRVAESLRQSCQRISDLVCRLGGEEFAVLLANTDWAQANHLLERVRRNVHAMYIVHSASLVSEYITVSIGAGVLDDHSKWLTLSPKSLFECADDALYESKRQGRNCLILRPVEMV